MKQQTFQYTLTKEDETKKLENILRSRFHFSQKVIQKIKQGEKAWLDGAFVYLNTRGFAGQQLVVQLEEEEEPTVPGEILPLTILYEDEFFLAVDKPAGQIVHPNGLHQSGSLANAVVGHWASQGQARLFRPISRIDRNTSGIILIAKSRYAHQQVAWLATKNFVEKKYQGLIEGSFPWMEGELSFPIRIKEGSRILRETHPDGLPARTLFRTIKKYAPYTHLEFTLITGRTHQIRVHCQHTGHPLLGDDLYGGHTDLISRQALHCSSYSFVHPITKEFLSIKSSLPEDIRRLLCQSPYQMVNKLSGGATGATIMH